MPRPVLTGTPLAVIYLGSNHFSQANPCYPTLFTLPRENTRLIPFRSAGLVRVAQGGPDSLHGVAQTATPGSGGG